MHSEIARMFYLTDLPFHLVKNPYDVSAFSFAANNSMSGYLPPDYNMLRTTLLQKQKANVGKLFEPIKETRKEKGLSVVSYGVD